MSIHISTYYDKENERAEFWVHEELLATLQFQNGLLSEAGINGVTNEAVIEVLIERIKDLNNRAPCRENSIVKTKLQEALFWLEERTRLRVDQGVESTHAPHTS